MSANLTAAAARERAALVDDVRYLITLDLTGVQRAEGPHHFATTTTVSFTSREPGAPTTLDLIAPAVRAVTLNGTALDPGERFDGSRIVLPTTQEHNEVVVEATGAYTNTGEGLHRFVDPADGQVYLYSQFQVADARRVFACFDQPDIKAVFELTVTAPQDWAVISTSPTPEPVPAGDGLATWTFAPTPLLSTYVTSLVAGPYVAHHDSVTTRSGEVPLGLYCRASLEPYLDADAFLDTTKRGFAYYEQEFDFAFPFEKYDQIFTPEYNMGAMENVAAVTFNEKYVFRAKVSDVVVERRGLTNLHELAHMWFGNLVTMRWWDDLWLNESFAEWASVDAQARATQWESAWTTFAIVSKSWAYRADSLSSTHPVAADIPDLDAIAGNFDGITYAKGASTLKQLVAYVGRDAFITGVQRYFRRHAWGNTELADLLVELEATSGRDLRTWSRLWLETSGVNTLHPEIEVDDAGIITGARIRQTAPESLPTLRPHRLVVGSYDYQGDSLERVDRYELDVDGPVTELPALVGRPRPALLLVNDEDLAYAKVRLDPQSLATFVASPRAVIDSLARCLAQGAAWDMTRDAEMRPRDYVSLALRALDGERDATMVRALLGQLSVAGSVYVAPEHRRECLRHIAIELRRLAHEAPAGSDTQLQLVTAWASTTTDDADLDEVAALLDGTSTLPGLAVDADMRWTLLTALATSGRVDRDTIVQAMDTDRTASGQEHAALALGSLPTAADKEAAWQRGVVEATESNKVVEATGFGFARTHEPEILRPYVERFLAMLEDTWARHSFAMAEDIVVAFYPATLADDALLEATQGWLDEHPDAPASLRRVIAEHRDAVARALRAQARDRESA